jgi:hypothetical protein
MVSEFEVASVGPGNFEFPDISPRFWRYFAIAKLFCKTFAARRKRVDNLLSTAVSLATFSLKDQPGNFSLKNNSC